MNKKRKPKGYWKNKNNCENEALKYKTRVEFQKKSVSAYETSRKNGWLDECCKHMEFQQLPNGYWSYNKERCKEEALKYKTRTEFKYNSRGAFFAAYQNDWLDDICSHMKKIRNPNNYWSKEKCHEEALKYDTKTKFRDNSPLAYDASKKKGFIDKICSHMKPVGNYSKRLIYVFEFPDKSVYIGLTYNSEKRYYEHMKGDKKKKKSAVYKYFKKTNLRPEFKILTKYIKLELAIKKEKYFLEQYKDDGWKILNKIKTGGIGGTVLIWTKEKCISEALKYKYRTDFHNNSSGAYGATRKNNWMEEVCSHMIRKAKSKKND